MTTSRRAHRSGLLAPVRAVQAFVLVACGLLLGVSLGRTGGRLTYSLDDPYIHLSLSTQILHGHYGLSPLEHAAPSSSIVWPFLLAPFAGWSAFDWVPLIINVTCATVSVALIYRILRTGWRSWDTTGWPTAAVTILLALATNLIGLAFTGMEHSLQVLLVLTIALGLARLLREDRAPNWWFWGAIVLLPLIRYESLSVSVVAAAIAALWGHRRAAAVALGGAVSAMVAFSLFLRSMDLSALPSSVLIKSDAAAAHGLLSHLDVLRQAWVDAVGLRQPMLLLLLLSVGASIFALRSPGLAFRSAATLVPMASTAVLVAHISFAQDGWFYRYEAYALAFVLPLMLSCLPEWGAAWNGIEQRRGLAMTAIAIVVLGYTANYGMAIVRTPAATAAIHEQQYQMHRFVVNELRQPVAANDIGELTYRNPYYVLDLWGLGSEPARKARLAARPGWMDRLADTRHVEVALIYRVAFQQSLPASWIHVGQLTSDDQGHVFSRTVDIYARTPEAADQVRQAIARMGRHPDPHTTLVALVPATR